MKSRNLNDQLVTLLSRHHLLSAHQLLELLSSNQQKYNKTSVYRALERLLAEEKICQYVFDGKEAVYELRDIHHDHAICERCGDIQAVECHHPSVALKNFTVDHHHTLIYGLCNHCHSATSVS